MDLPQHVFMDTFGMTTEQVNAMASKEEILLTEFTYGGKRIGGDIIGPFRDRGLGEEVVGVLISQHDTEEDAYASLAQLQA